MRHTGNRIGGSNPSLSANKLPRNSENGAEGHDLVEGLIRLMKTGDDITGPINLGNPAEFRILDLAAQIIDITGSRSKIVFRPLPQDDPRQRRPDILKAQASLSWTPKTSLGEGLKKTVEYFEGLLQDSRVREVLVDIG